MSSRGALEYSDYIRWAQSWLNCAYGWGAENARLCLNVPLDTTLFGNRRPAFADYVKLAEDCGWRYRIAIVWDKGHISRRLAWGTWSSPSAPHVIAPVEMVGVFYKGQWGRPRKDGVATITAQEFKDWTNGYWYFSPESATRIGHPAPFPIDLPRRCVRLFSWLGDTVLDPFCGSGTTLVAALQDGRRALGSDISAEYCEMARQRVETEVFSQPSLFGASPIEPSPADVEAAMLELAPPTVVGV